MSQPTDGGAVRPRKGVNPVNERDEAVGALLGHVRRLIGDDPEPAAWQLARAGELLSALALRTELFPDAQFPAPSSEEHEALYLLGESPDGSHALYIWRPAPGFSTPVHDHSTWAVVAGIEGEEPQVLWRRTDDGLRPGHCAIEPAGSARIGPGQHLAFGPRDIHSVAIDGPVAIKHLHLYGHTLMDLPERRDYDPLTGAITSVPEKPDVREAVVSCAGRSRGACARAGAGLGKGAEPGAPGRHAG